MNGFSHLVPIGHPAAGGEGRPMDGLFLFAIRPGSRRNLAINAGLSDLPLGSGRGKIG
jgi:hypothetical protein